MTTSTGCPLDRELAGREMFDLAAELFPLCRSIAGEGLRETLARVGRRIPLTLSEVPTGTPVLDWTVPREWHCRDAWIADRAGRRIVDFRQSNLHVLNYSLPVRRRVGREELLAHVYTLPDRPEWIPYRTSYYEERWGFCLSQRQLAELTDEAYDVVIDATLYPGSLTYGECFLPGESEGEVLLSCHCCHPSLANDNLSAVAVAVALARLLADRPRRLGYRFLFAPGTIGAIAWLSRNESLLPRIRHGLVLALLGRPGPLTYKRTRRGDAPLDRAAEYLLPRIESGSRVVDFEPYGYDERQYNSPGYDLPVGRLTRAANGEYPEYHTSADNLELIRPETLADSLAACLELFGVLEDDRTYRSLNPKGEPQLGRRGLYRAVGGAMDARDVERAYLWVLNLADGRHSLLDMARRSGLEFATIARAAELLCKHDLLEEV